MNTNANPGAISIALNPGGALTMEGWTSSAIVRVIDAETTPFEPIRFALGNVNGSAGRSLVNELVVYEANGLLSLIPLDTTQPGVVFSAESLTNSGLLVADSTGDQGLDVHVYGIATSGVHGSILPD